MVDKVQVAWGRRAAELLLERINGLAPPHGRTFAMPYQVIIRRST